ncbi:hypothetical protein OHB37_13410 [Streptomyces albidoflavus]|uniref:hypothetical protein n=1 Tax=Streptomyces TaxID=1883 RepID=UPI001BEB34C2|nr:MULTISPECIES: hypothetical protein [unclassified Streptomyces]MBT2880910.1 hypothetical protein [Streptomyces sp. McG6]MBT2887675.1 hypothetical protein [Streptomyces sp. McG5]MBT2892746.1 hypothetical protein [Streptomyces sp. McG2]WSB15123.1 hypothetical protein OHB37_13410 [Streptomyces albidoflavus]
MTTIILLLVMGITLILSRNIFARFASSQNTPFGRANAKHPNATSMGPAVTGSIMIIAAILGIFGVLEPQ